MKIEQDKTFKPITIILETEKEVEDLLLWIDSTTTLGATFGTTYGSFVRDLLKRLREII